MICASTSAIVHVSGATQRWKIPENVNEQKEKVAKENAIDRSHIHQPTYIILSKHPIHSLTAFLRIQACVLQKINMNQMQCNQ